MLIIIALLLLALCIGLLLGRKATIILICIIYAIIGNWGSAKAAMSKAQQAAAIQADIKIMSKYIPLEGVTVGSADRIIGNIASYDHSRNGWASMYFQLAAADLMGLPGLHDYNRAVRKAPDLCNAGRRLLRDKEYISVVMQHTNLPTNAKKLIEFCYSDEFVNVMRERVDY